MYTAVVKSHFNNNEKILLLFSNPKSKILVNQQVISIEIILFCEGKKKQIYLVLSTQSDTSMGIVSEAIPESISACLSELLDVLLAT